MQPKNNFESVLAIGAHPDDIEYGCFGYLSKLASTGSVINAYIGTLGSEGDPTSGKSRLDETEKALNALPIQKLYSRQEIGFGPADFNLALGELYRVIQETSPDLILSLSQHDTHQEHRQMHDLTIGAARRSNASLLCYSILSNTPQFRPTLFVDISEHFEAKKRALACHRSQSDKYYMSEAYLNIFHTDKYANLHGIKFCESYEIIRMFR